MTITALLLPGDGIGPEVSAEMSLVIESLNRNFALDMRVETALVGGASIDASGVPIAESTLRRAGEVDAVLLGAVGGPKWADVDYAIRPEAGLLRLRQKMEVYANIRPIRCFSALADASTMKREHVEDLDILIVRELTGGVYFGEPRGVETLPNGERRGINTHAYHSSEIRRVARIAFDLALSRSGRVCSVEKSNVMEAGLLWREEVQSLRDAEYPQLELSHMLADNMAMQLVRKPKQFDVILTDNLFGDLLSDEAAMLTGSLGMLPSASIGEAHRPGLYEPVHGSAPDIAGQGRANPCASILSLALALRHSLGRPDLGLRLEHAIANVLALGIRTSDLDGTASTCTMGKAIVEEMMSVLIR